MKKKSMIPPSETETMENQDAQEMQDPKVAKKEKVRKTISIVINVILVLAIVLAAVSTYLAFVSSSGQGAPSIFSTTEWAISFR